MPNHITNVISVSGPGAHEFLMKFINKHGYFDFNKVIPIPKELDIPASSWVEGLAHALRGKPSPYASEELAQARSKEEMLAYWKKKIGSEFKQNLAWAKQYLENIEKYGYPTWYEANRAIWGTKWNAYSQQFLNRRIPSEIKKGVKFRCETFTARHETAYQKRVIKKWQKRYQITSWKFETAWSTPVPIWENMINQLIPGLTLAIQYADEDTGNNCGYMAFTLDPEVGLLETVNIAPSWRDQSSAERKQWMAFAFELCHPNTDPRKYGYDENWHYSDEVYEAWEKEHAA